MAFPSRPGLFDLLKARAGKKRYSDVVPVRREPDLNPSALTLARRAPAVSAQESFGRVAEIARSSPYLAVPVVRPEGTLLGLATEARMAKAFLAARDAAARDAVRLQPIEQGGIEPCTESVSPCDRADTVSARMDACGRDLLPVLDGRGIFLGLISRSDLVQELVRPFRPPTIGGMATPRGVYLTTGSAAGGVSSAALVATGFLMFAVQGLPLLVLNPIGHWAAHATHASAGVTAFLSDQLPAVASLALFLAAIRFSPLAGYHAAEHQVVHAIERSEPLLVETVRQMPRVHPRCGTNLVAGLFLFGSVQQALGFLMQRVSPAAAQSDFGSGLCYALGAAVALAYWRSVGSFLQRYITTRPATDSQIESGIRAGREALDRHGRVVDAVVPPYQRLWRMGLLQMVLGLMIGYALLMLVSGVCPSARPWIGPLLPTLLHAAG